MINRRGRERERKVRYITGPFLIYQRGRCKHDDADATFYLTECYNFVSYRPINILHEDEDEDESHLC